MGHIKEEANYSDTSREVSLSFRRRRVNQHLYVHTLILRILVWLLLGSTTVIMLPTILTYDGWYLLTQQLGCCLRI